MTEPTTPTEASAIACPPWCQRQHDLRGAEMVRHAASVLERQIGDAIVYIEVSWTQRVDGDPNIGPGIRLGIQETGWHEQLDWVAEEARINADVLALAGTDAWLVDAIRFAADLIDEDVDHDPHAWQVAP